MPKNRSRLSRVWKDAAKQTWAEIRSDDVFGRAAQLAYYFFLALFPMLICVIAALSIFGVADRGRALLFHFFGQALPSEAFALINQTFTAIIKSSGSLKMSFGVIGALWSASMGVSALMDTLNSTYGVKEQRSLLKQYATAVGLTIGVALLLVISVLIVIFGDRIARAIPFGNAAPLLWKLALWPVAVALILFALAIIYYFAPDLSHPEWHWVTPGAVMTMVVWVGVSLALRVYLAFFGSYSAMYGSLGAVIILLLWFYLTGVAVLSGGALNGVLERLARNEEALNPKLSNPSKPKAA